MIEVKVVVNESFARELRTSFYRDVHGVIAGEFDCLRENVAVEMGAYAPGCSTGQPPISISITAHDRLSRHEFPQTVVCNIAEEIKHIAKAHCVQLKVRVTLRLAQTFTTSIG